MRQNNQSKIQQALSDKKMIEQIANSPDAQKLASMLTLSLIHISEPTRR